MWQKHKLSNIGSVVGRSASRKILLEAAKIMTQITYLVITGKTDHVPNSLIPLEKDVEKIEEVARKNLAQETLANL